MKVFKGSEQVGELDISFVPTDTVDYEALLADMRKKAFGTFDTNIPCTCRRGTIKDHATGNDPNYRPSLSEMRFGPGPSPREQCERFRAYHRYWCEECGALYEGSVIEGKLKYVPPEKRAGFRKK